MKRSLFSFERPQVLDEALAPTGLDLPLTANGKTSSNWRSLANMFFRRVLKGDAVIRKLDDRLSLVGYCVLVLSSLLLSIVSSEAIGQSGNVKVGLSTSSSADKPVILLKWYSSDLVYSQGVYVYRKIQGSLNWERISTLPVVKKQTLNERDFAADPDLQDFVDIINTEGGNALKDDMLLLNLLVKSFQSNAFADFLGIFFQDSSVVSGIAYEYKITRLQNTREVLVGVSSPIVATGYLQDLPIDSITVVQDEKAHGFNWYHDEKRYYGINVYRKISNEATYAKLNANPIIISMVNDSVGNLVYPNPMFKEDRKLQENTYYDYRLTGAGYFGEETAMSNPVRVFHKDITPPKAPTELQGRVDSMKVSLSWKANNSGDLNGFYIYQSSRSDGPFQRVTQESLGSPIEQWSDSLKVPGPYYYYVSSVDAAGNEAPSNKIFVEVQDVIPPAAPSGLMIMADTGRIILRWDMGVEPDLKGYYVYRTIDSSQLDKFVFFNAEPILDNQLVQEIPANTKNEFYYYLVAVDTSFNRSRPSQFVSARMPDIIPPERPFIKEVTYGEGDISIHWIKNVDEDLAGYHVYRADTSKRFMKINANVLARENFRYTDRDTNENQEYYYFLVALDSTGNESPRSNQVYAKRIERELRTDQTINLKIRYRKRRSQSELFWDEITTSPIRGYVVFEGISQETLRPITGLIKTTSYLATSDRANQKLFYQIRAYTTNAIFYSRVVKTNP